MRSSRGLKRRTILFLSGLVVSILAIALVVGLTPLRVAQAANPPAYVSHTLNVSSSWRSNAVFSHTVAAGPYRLLVVAVMIRADESVSSVTYADESLSAAKVQDGGGSDDQRVELWYLVNPPVGSANVIVHFASSVNPSGIAAVNFTGVHQSSPMGASAGNNATSGTDVTTIITTNNADSLIFGVASTRGGDTDPFIEGTNVTELWGADTAYGSGDSNDDDGVWGGRMDAHTATNYTFYTTSNSSDHWAIACVELKAASAPTFSSITEDKLAYKDGDTVTLMVTLEDNNTACTLTADFSNIDDQYVSGAESVVNWGTDNTDNNGDGHIDEPAEQGVYVITYAISTVNNIGDDSSYSVPVTATDGVGNSTTDNSTSLTLDNTSPPSPANLVATALAGGDIQLSWTLPSSEADVSRYNIYRALTSGGQDFSNPLDYVSKGTATYTDSATTSGTTYYYVVRAQDVAGNTDTNTTEASATAGITTGPSFSSITSDKSVYKDGDTITLTVTLANHNTGCTLTADFSNIDSQYVTGGESVVNWGTDGVDNNGDGKTDEPAEQGVYVISYLISLVNTKADGSHSVPVTATDAAANSASSSISLTLDNTAPPAPTSLSATAIAGGSIRLTWTASSPETNIAQYNIYRATTSGSQDYSSPLDNVSAGTTTYTDTTTTDGVTYYYVVRAQDSIGNIETNTNEVSATAGVVGPSIGDFQIYIKYQGALLYNLVSSTDRNNPSVFASGSIDEIYLKVNLLAGSPLSESASSIGLYKLVDSEAEEVSGTQEINQDASSGELIFHISPVFDPGTDEHSRDGLYWVDVTAVDIAGNTNNFDFYFVYDTTPPEVPSFQTSSFDSATGSITVSGSTVPDELSDPQEVEIFVNDSSKGTATAGANYEFSKSGIGLVRGINYIAAQSMDKAGNKSPLSKSLKLSYNPESLLSIVIRSPHVVRSGSSTEPVKIIYSVTQPAEITIRIFNLKGELVKEWRGSASSGDESGWNWYGKNMHEEEVNNGVYIFRIKAKASSGENDSSTKLVGVLR